MKYFKLYIIAVVAFISIGSIQLLQISIASILENRTTVLLLGISVLVFFLKWRKSMRLKETFIPIQFIDA